MTEPFRSAVALRADLCQSLIELRQRATRPLPDNATVYVDDTAALYRLYKGLGTTFDTLTGEVVIPADGSTNRWVMQEAFGSSPWSAVEVATTLANIAAPGINVWGALGSISGSFVRSSGGSDVFEVSATSSLLTYHGLTRLMLVTSIVSVTATNAQIFSSVVSHNDDVPAGSSSAHLLEGEQSGEISAGGRACITTQRAVLLSPGDTLRQMLRSGLGSDTIQAQQFSLSVTPQ